MIKFIQRFFFKLFLGFPIVLLVGSIIYGLVYLLAALFSWIATKNIWIFSHVTYAFPVICLLFLAYMIGGDVYEGITPDKDELTHYYPADDSELNRAKNNSK